MSRAVALFRDTELRTTTRYLAVREDGEFFTRTINPNNQVVPEWEPAKAVIRDHNGAVLFHTVYGEPEALPVWRMSINLGAITLP